jgi:Putative auto-transporter adhesin, head GIN domain
MAPDEPEYRPRFAEHAVCRAMLHPVDLPFAQPGSDATMSTLRYEVPMQPISVRIGRAPLHALVLLASLLHWQGASALDLSGVWPVAGSGPVVKESRPVGRFRALELDTDARVVVRQGDSHAVEVQAEGNVAPLIEAYVDNGTLVVRDNKRFKSSNAAVIVTLRRISSISTTRSVAVSAENLDTPDLSLSMGGSRFSADTATDPVVEMLLIRRSVTMTAAFEDLKRLLSRTTSVPLSTYASISGATLPSACTSTEWLSPCLTTTLASVSSSSARKRPTGRLSLTTGPDPATGQTPLRSRADAPCQCSSDARRTRAWSGARPIRTEMGCMGASCRKVLIVASGPGCAKGRSTGCNMARQTACSAMRARYSGPSGAIVAQPSDGLAR